MSYSYDANDRLSTDTYDANGNTTSSAGITNTYDFENRMLKYGSLALIYDGDGNRVSETVGGTTTKFLVDDKNPTGFPQVLDEIVNGSVSRTYAYGRQRISENQLVNGTWMPIFYGYDGHGNVRFLTKAAGAVTDTYQYDVTKAQVWADLQGLWGLAQTSPTPFKFNSNARDLRRTIIQVSECVKRSGPTAPAHYTVCRAYLRENDEDDWRIDLKNIYGINLRQ